MKVELISYTKDPLKTIATAGAMSYKTPINEKTIPSILNHCYKSGHHSIFEFADFTFKIEGISRNCSHQLVRHRMASIVQESQRYVEANNDYYIPEAIEKSDFLDMYVKKINESMSRYNILLYLDIPKEDARYVLPSATTTSMVIKMNLRSLMNFMNLRLCTRAQKEIRDVANAMRTAIVQVEPEVRKYLVPKCEIHAPYNFCTEQKSCGRHRLLKEVYNGN